MVRSCSRMRRVRSVVDSSSYCIISATVFSLTRWPLRTTVSTISRAMWSSEEPPQYTGAVGKVIER